MLNEVWSRPLAEVKAVHSLLGKMIAERESADHARAELTDSVPVYERPAGLPPRGQKGLPPQPNSAYSLAGKYFESNDGGDRKAVIAWVQDRNPQLKAGNISNALSVLKKKNVVTNTNGYWHRPIG